MEGWEGGPASLSDWEDAECRAGSFESEQRQEKKGEEHHRLPNQLTLNVATSFVGE